MLRFPAWKIVSILAMTAFALLLIVPSLMSPNRREALISHLPKWVPARAIVLGLDLQGGSHVLLEVDSNSVVKSLVDNLRDSVRRVLREEKVAITGGIGAQPRGVQLRIPDPGERARVMPKLKQLAASAGSGLSASSRAAAFDVNENDNGLIQFTVTEAGVDSKVRRAVEQSIEVLRRRVDALGTTEPNIQRQGADRILVEVPGLQDTSKLKEILGTTAKLEFRLVAEPGADPADVEFLEDVEQPGKLLPVEKRVMVQGEDLTDAQPGFDPRTQEPIVNFRFNIRGGQRFGEVTSENVGKLFAIILDGKVISAPRIISPITGGSGQISGHFTVEAANNLAILLRAGALPAKLTIVEERTVGPGLGQDFDRRGQARGLCRRRPRRLLYADHLRHIRRLRQYRAGGPCLVHFCQPRASRGDAHPAGHRGDRPHHRHGGRFQCLDLRTHPGGSAYGSLDHFCARRRI